MEDVVQIVVVELEPGISTRLKRLFQDQQVRVSRESSIDHVVESLERARCDVLIITGAALRAGRVEGVELLELVTAKSPHTRVLFLSQPKNLAMVKAVLKNTSYQYAKLPIADSELGWLVESALEERPAAPAPLEPKAVSDLEAQPMLGRSRPIQDVQRQIRQAAATDIPVLIVGETGTGKDLAAQAIHRGSGRAKGPYIPVHLGALPQELVASELFGHEKGAFTGALESRQGKFEQADGGTIFLDEISTIDERIQVSLLRLIEDKKFNRLGGRKTLSSNARIVAASNENLDELVIHGRFREDLMYRLDVFRIVMPPLRERHGDIPLLVNAFMKTYNRAFHKRIRGIAPECIAFLEEYDWPGNVRELKNVIQRAVLICTGEVLLPEHLPAHIRAKSTARPRVFFEIGTPLQEVEREVIARTLSFAKSRKHAAELLGISRRALYNKIQRYGI